MLFIKESGEVKDVGDATDPKAWNWGKNVQALLVCDPPSRDYDDETLVEMALKEQSPATEMHVPAGLYKAGPREHILLRAA